LFNSLTLKNRYLVEDLAILYKGKVFNNVPIVKKKITLISKKEKVLFLFNYYFNKYLTITIKKIDFI
jgi:hypothetical protein